MFFCFIFSNFSTDPFALLGLPKQQLPRYEDVDVGQSDLARHDALELRLRDESKQRAREGNCSDKKQDQRDKQCAVSLPPYYCTTFRQDFFRKRIWV